MAKFSKLLLNFLIKSFILFVLCVLVGFLPIWIDAHSMAGDLLGILLGISFLVTIFLFPLHIICFLLSLLQQKNDNDS